MRPKTLDKTFRICVVLCCLLVMSEGSALSSEKQICNGAVIAPGSDVSWWNHVADGSSDLLILENLSPMVLVLDITLPVSDLAVDRDLIAAKSDDEIDEWLDEIISFNGDPVAKSDDEIDEWLDEIISLIYPGNENPDCDASPGVIFLLGGDGVNFRIVKSPGPTSTSVRKYLWKRGVVQPVR